MHSYMNHIRTRSAPTKTKWEVYKYIRCVRRDMMNGIFALQWYKLALNLVNIMVSPLRPQGGFNYSYQCCVRSDLEIFSLQL